MERREVQDENSTKSNVRRDSCRISYQLEVIISPAIGQLWDAFFNSLEERGSRIASMTIPLASTAVCKGTHNCTGVN